MKGWVGLGAWRHVAEMAVSNCVRTRLGVKNISFFAQGKPWFSRFVRLGIFRFIALDTVSSVIRAIGFRRKQKKKNGRVVPEPCPPETTSVLLGQVVVLVYVVAVQSPRSGSREQRVGMSRGESEKKQISGQRSRKLPRVLPDCVCREAQTIAHHNASLGT